MKSHPLFLKLVSASMACSYGQLNAAAIAGATFNFSNTQASSTDPANLDSIEIGGTTYATAFFPLSYTNIDLTDDAEIRLNAIGLSATPASPNWNDAALLAFQSSNLNYYQQIDGGNLDATWRLDFGTSLPTTSDLIFAITERNSNNTFFIQAFDSSGGSLGSFSTLVTDLAPTGAISAGTNINNTESIDATVYPISDLTGGNGAQISYLEITNNSSTSDGGDGKIIFFQETATTPVPEPGSILLSGLSMLLLALGRQRRSH